MSKFAHLVSAFTKERLTGKIENGFFLTLKETLVVGLAQRAIICIFLTDSQKLVSVYKGSIRLVPPIIDDKDIDLRTESSEQLSTLPILPNTSL